MILRSSDEWLARDLWTPSPGSWFHPTRNSYPSTSDMRPGDLVLFRPIHASPVEREIQRYQREVRCQEAGADFTHAAIYLGYDSLLIEAVPEYGVSISNLEDCLSEYDFWVRRLPECYAGTEVAKQAMVYWGAEYDFEEIVRLYLDPTRLQAKLEDEGPASTICSMLFERAVVAAFQEPVFWDVDRWDANTDVPTTPGTLARVAEERLPSVSLTWRRVERPLAALKRKKRPKNKSWIPYLMTLASHPSTNRPLS